MRIKGTLIYFFKHMSDHMTIVRFYRHC